MPGGNSFYTFEADKVVSENNDEYYWTGYNADGSSFFLSKRSDYYLGGIYLSPTSSHFGIFSISATKAIMVRYHLGIITNVECGQLIEGDEDADDDLEERGSCASNNIRVLFLFTASSASLAPSPVLVAPAIISQINASTLASGLSETDIHFQWAGTVLLPGFMESPDIDSDLNELCGNSTAHNLRDAYYADIVVLLTRATHTDGAGKAGGIAVFNNKAYAIAHLRASFPGFTATHEIAHLMGARHQRCFTCLAGGCDSWIPPYHGFSVGDNFKTIMHTLNCATGRTRIGRFSSLSAPPFMGSITGDPQNNNALKLFKRAGKVACFRADPPSSGGGSGPIILVSINGQTSVPNCQGYYPYLAVVSQPFVNPLTYKWEISPLGVGNWTTVSTNNSYVLMDPTNLPNWFTLRLTVTDAVGTQGVAHKEIQKSQCGAGGGEDRSIIGNYSENLPIQYYPNPTFDYLVLERSNAYQNVRIFDINGVEQKNYTYTKDDKDRSIYNVKTLPPGMYFLSTNNTSQTITLKFIKQ